MDGTYGSDCSLRILPAPKLPKVFRHPSLLKVRLLFPYQLFTTVSSLAQKVSFVDCFNGLTLERYHTFVSKVSGILVETNGSCMKLIPFHREYVELYLHRPYTLSVLVT